MTNHPVCAAVITSTNYPWLCTYTTSLTTWFDNRYYMEITLQTRSDLTISVNTLQSKEVV